MSSKCGTISSPAHLLPRPRQSEAFQPSFPQSRRQVRYTSISSGTAANSSSNNTNQVVAGTDCTSGRPNRRKHARRVYLGPPRCSRTETVSLLPSSAYMGYGRSTDENFEQSNIAHLLLPNPYLELVNEVSTELTRKDNSTPAPPTSNGKIVPEVGGGRGPASRDIPSKRETKRNLEGAEVDEKLVRGLEEQDDDDDDDDDEDEEGLPQAVRTSDPQDIMEEHLDRIKVLHQAKMEEMSRSVRPERLLRQLERAGYFNYNYYNHARATADNYNLKQGHKKPIERLLNLLSVH